MQKAGGPYRRLLRPAVNLKTAISWRSDEIVVQMKCSAFNGQWWRSKESFFNGFSEEKTKKNTFFQKQSGEVAENKGSALKTNRNKPENKAEKLLKTCSCGKNKPEQTLKQSYRSY
ncbi:MAG TPA: hypothetical protein VFZ27_06065 [Terriglobia bacterium]|nr:hypothetical protein [Terriglobia bacterium]